MTAVSLFVSGVVVVYFQRNERAHFYHDNNNNTIEAHRRGKEVYLFVVFSN